MPKSFFEDARSDGPFEFLLAISFSLEYVLTNLLFVPFMSGAAHNGDMSTVTFGFSAQSDESRHMTLGIECIKFMLEQDPANVPIVQKWIDKWFWRGYRVLTLVAMMQDYMLPKRVMSWKEAWEMYAEQNGGALFRDLARYGIREPKGWKQACEGKDHISHQAWNTFYNYCAAAPFHTWIPKEEEMQWLSEKYPDTFDKYYRPAWSTCARSKNKAIASPTRRCPCCAPLARFRWCLPSRAIRPRFATANRTTRATSTTFAATVAKKSSTTSRKNTSSRGCRYTRFTRATASSRAPTPAPKDSIR